ncbi:ribosomal protein L7/L12 [Planotetraspora sp. A-T 1434]|uniref:ribosomal protein L7/L12 n=1 Tax=Planotetraspora sp. A-T 1434 TaxID=2979219 RepID=UPI0021C09973|nr:ribosomal protein L7/L12 [Planotetraspora sp. A-T 1434]MCT9933076.1 ribosomal protein L7/L12 [Planotetraspora sp. A-T 1434]
MSGLGVTELLVVGLVGLIFLGLVMVVFFAVRAGARPSTQLGWRSATLPPPVSADLQNHVRHLYAAGRKIEAIKVIREATGLGLREAKTLAEALASGQVIPAVPVGDPARPDLASRARQLKAAGRAEQAVFLVRGETGMGQSEAEAFIEAL